MSDEVKIRGVTLHFPLEPAVTIPGERVAGCGITPQGVMFVDELLPDGGRVRHVGIPHSVDLAPPSAIKVATTLPERLRQ